jgi:[protein-PII] uridylyltransferase
LRDARAALVADVALQGRAFGSALAAVIDAALVAAFTEIDAPGDVAVVALGSYGRRELCPGSDVDVLLVHALKGRKSTTVVRDLTERLWYPLWDAGFVTGHGARSIKDSMALADEDLDAMTALLEVRHVAGATDLTVELEHKARDLALKRQARVLEALADGADARRLRPGAIAEMLEPDLKEGAGGLRDVQSIEWGGWAFGAPGGTKTLVGRGYLTEDDLARVEAGRELLLDARVGLQRVAGGRTDRLPLQEQDAVAAQLGFADADALVRDLANAAREIAWITGDVWSRVRDALRGPGGRRGSGDRIMAEGVMLRDGRIHVAADADGTVSALRALEAACAAAEEDVPFDRASLTRLRATSAPTWDVWERAGFVRLLRSGTNAVPVFEALDHEGVLELLLPEWAHVRSRPQRNAYHRYTVDRHLLEAVAQCALLLDAGDRLTAGAEEFDVDAIVARACRRPELLLFGALLHDLAKGLPGDHSTVGAETAERICRRMHLDSEGREIVVWLVRNHLLMAEVATRRDLSDAAVADNIAAACAADAERLRLLYLLTIGDSKATGPAAWSPSKGALVRDLFIKAAAAIERGEARVLAADRRDALVARLGAARAHAFLDRLPDSYLLAFDVDTIDMHEALVAAAPTVRCEGVAGGDVEITVAAADRPGLLATLAGALTVCGIDVEEAHLFGTTDGLALDVFRGTDPFGRMDDEGARAIATIERALAGEIDLAARVDERRKSYAALGARSGPVHVDIDVDESDTDTVVEVHADDEIGLLYRLASTLADLALDVQVAKVATLGKRVVDVFYVRDASGAKVTDERVLDELRAALGARTAG